MVGVWAGRAQGWGGAAAAARRPAAGSSSGSRSGSSGSALSTHPLHACCMAALTLAARATDCASEAARSAAVTTRSAGYPSTRLGTMRVPEASWKLSDGGGNVSSALAPPRTSTALDPIFSRPASTKE